MSKQRHRLIHSVFLALMLLEFFGPAFMGQALFDSAAILSFSLYLASLCQRRAVNRPLFLIRLGIWATSLLYSGLLAWEAFQHPNLLVGLPTPHWQALTAVWFILGFVVIALSTKELIRFFIGLQRHPARFIVVIYTAVALVSAMLLVLPVCLQPGVQLSFIDALFTTVSAISGTGLVVVNTAETFSYLGYVILMVVVQTGGIGVITFSGILLLLIGKELGLNESIIQDTTERMYFSGSVKAFAGTVAIIMFVFESIGAAFLYPWMATQFDHPLEAAFHSVFQSVSAFCTAGFTTLPSGMVEAESAPLPLITIGLLSIFGMLGLPTLLSLLSLIKPKQIIRRITPYAKLELLLGASILGFGTLSLFVVEFTNDIYESVGDQFLNAFFQSAMRNAGFNSVVIADMSLPSIFILMSLMIAGGAPMSTSGGIKTSTIGVILIFVFSFIKGSPEAHFAKRRVPNVYFLKAATIIFLFFFILFLCFVILILTQDIDPLDLLFESVSALSVTGFSLGATQELNKFGKGVVIVMMMIGRIGLLTAVYALIVGRKSIKYRLPQGDFYVG